MSGLTGLLAWFNDVAASAFWFAVVVGVLVFLHEAGHFLVARLFGIRVDVFSLGFGKRLFGAKRGNTDYRVSLVPLGGYVKMTGGSEHGDESSTEPLPPDYFLARPRWQRFLVMVAGVVVNIALAVVLFSVSFMVGTEVPAAIPPILQLVSEGSAAAGAGLQPGDRIIAVAGKSVASWDEVLVELLHNAPREVTLEVEREGSKRTVSLLPVLNEHGIPRIGAQVRAPAIVSRVDPTMPAMRAGLLSGDRIVGIDGMAIVDVKEATAIIHSSVGRELKLAVERGSEQVEVKVTPVEAVDDDGKAIGRIGLVFAQPTEFVKLSAGPAFAKGADLTWRQATVVFSVLKLLVSGNLPFGTMSGPLEIARVSRDAARSSQLLTWMAFISLQLGIMNLILPIPNLDGGQIFILATEGILRRDLSQVLKERLQLVGFFALVGLMAAVLVMDIMKSLGTM